MFDGVTWGITVSELITNTLEFIMLFKEFVLLGIVLILAPRLIDFFKGVIRNRRTAE